jgi:hypothetical protein
MLKQPLIMKYSILLLILITTSSISYGQDSTKLKRTPYKLTVVVDKETVYEEDIKANLYIFPDNTVQLYPGETIYIQVEQEKGIIKSMNAVKENISPNKTLIIAFSQTVTKGVHESMMLKVTNPFAQNLIYKAKIFILKQKKWVDTDVYPVEAGLSGFEIWPDIITSIGLGHWEFQTK